MRGNGGVGGIILRRGVSATREMNGERSKGRTNEDSLLSWPLRRRVVETQEVFVHPLVIKDHIVFAFARTSATGPRSREARE